MSYFISILLVFTGFIKRKSKTITFLLITLMWILYGWNTGNADYSNYNIAYYNNAIYPLNYSKEIGFQLLCKLFYNIGVEYNQALIFISIIGLLLVYSTIRRYTKNTAFVFAMYFIFPFMLDVVQVRNFIAMAIVVFSLRFLIENKKQGKIKYIILVVLASTFHYAALFYLLFLLTEIKNTKKLTYFSITITIFFIILSYTGVVPLITYKILPSAKIYEWFTNKMDLGMFIMLIIHTTTLFLVNYAYKRIKNIEINNSHKSDIGKTKTELNKNFLNSDCITCNHCDININFINFVYKINIISLMVFIFYIFNMTFFRLYRNIFIINYTLFSIMLFNTKYDKKEKALFGLFIVILTIALAAYYIVIPHYDEVFKAVLKNNVLFTK